MNWFQSYSYNWAFPANHFFPLVFLPLLLVLLVWSLVWKGLALWKAAREGSTGWFVALLIISTVGILEILYLYVFSKPRYKSVEDLGVKK